MFYNLFFARFLFHFASKPQPYPRPLLFLPFPLYLNIIYASYFRSRNLQLLSPKIIFEGGSCRFFVQKSFFCKRSLMGFLQKFCEVKES